MIPTEEFVKLDKQLKEQNLPFDKGLPILRNYLWDIGEKYHVGGDVVFMQYMDWKTKKEK